MKTIKVSSALHFANLVRREGYDLSDESVYFLLPDIPATVQAEQEFIEQGGGIWGDRLLTFAKLAGIVSIGLSNPPNPISRSARLLLAEEVIRGAVPGLYYYRDIADLREFADSVLSVIAELKHAKISPQGLRAAADKVALAKFKIKLADICEIYSRYDSKLSALNLADDIDVLRLITENPDAGLLCSSLPQLKKLVVFGFYEFTETQMGVLERLDKNKIQVEVCEYNLGQGHEKKDIYLRGFDCVVDEAEHCVKRIKRLIEHENVSPSKIAVACKSGYDNSAIIKELFCSAGLDYSENGRASLSTSHIGKLMLCLINLKLSDFKKSYLFEFLRNPYVVNYMGNSPDFVKYTSDLEYLCLKERITGGLGSIINNNGFKKLKNSNKYSRVLELLLLRISKSFNSNKLPVLTDNLLSILEEIVLSKLRDNELIKSQSQINALSSAYNTLTEYRFIVNKYFGQSKVESLFHYSKTIAEILSQKNYSLTGPHEEDKIKKLDFLEARGTAFDYLLVLGAGEDEIPGAANSDPVLKNKERSALNKILRKQVFKTSGDIAHSEEQLVSLTINSSENVYVSYVNQDSRAGCVQPSFIINKFKVNSLDEKSDNICGEIITNHDRYKKLFSGFTEVDFDSPGQDQTRLRFIANGIRGEIKRHKRFSALQDNEGFIGPSDYLSSLNKFSVTELEAYGICPFRYFAAHILRLRFPEELEDEPRPLDQGSVYHRVLNLLFKELSKTYGKRLDLRDVPDSEVLRMLGYILESSEIESEFKWLTEVKRQLNIKSITEKILPAFVLSEANRIRQLNDNGFFPAEFEKELSLQIDGSTVSGKADRVDLSDSGAVVIDYKLRSLSGRKFCDYRNLQLPLYLNSLASDDVSQQGAYYRSTERPEEQVGMDAAHKDFEKGLEMSLEFVKSYIDNITKGVFPPSPQQKDIGFYDNTFELAKEKEAPCRFCEYSDLCRAGGAVYRTIKN